MSPSTTFRKTRLPLLIALALVVAAAVIVVYRITKPPKRDRSGEVVEMRQRSITEDPAVRGVFPDGWLVAQAGSGLPGPASERSRVQRVRAPRIFEGELSPGATRTVELSIAGSSGLSGSVRWVETSKPLSVTIALNGSTLAKGTTYRVGSNRGGSYLHAQTTTGGRATMSVTNTSGARAKVRLVFGASGP